MVTWELAKRKADKEGRLQYKAKNTRTAWESFKFYFVEFDGESDSSEVYADSILFAHSG